MKVRLLRVFLFKVLPMIFMLARRRRRARA